MVAEMQEQGRSPFWSRDNLVPRLGPSVMLLVSIVLVPLKAAGLTAAYAAAASAGLVGLITALFLTWRFPDSVAKRPDARSAVPIGTIVAVGLIITSQDAPVLECSVVGALGGLLLGGVVSPFWRPFPEEGQG
jgi:hypothetical protein